MERFVHIVVLQSRQTQAMWETIRQEDGLNENGKETRGTVSEGQVRWPCLGMYKVNAVRELKGRWVASMCTTGDLPRWLYFIRTQEKHLQAPVHSYISLVDVYCLLAVTFLRNIW